MSKIKDIESNLTKLSIEEMKAVRDWLDDIIEDQLELTDEFKQKVQRAKQEISDGADLRTRQPVSGD